MSTGLTNSILNIAAPDYCPPGWRRFQETCFQVHLVRKRPWDDARLDCRNRGGQLAVFENGFEPHKITKFMNDYLDEWAYISVGAKASSDGRWITVKNESFSLNKYSSLWGPNEPSGDGWCGALIFGEKWDVSWRGKGWRINDDACLAKGGFVCQRQKQDLSKHLGYCRIENLDTEFVPIFVSNQSVKKSFHNTS